MSLYKLDTIIFSLNKPLLGKKGLHYHKLLRDWELIVGDNISKYTIPVKISTIRQRSTPENILHIATNNASAAVELVYLLGILKEQVNFYFGYEYINQIKITQAVFKMEVKQEVLPVYKFNESQQQKIDFLVELYDRNDNIKDILIEFAKIIVEKEQLTPNLINNKAYN